MITCDISKGYKVRIDDPWKGGPNQDRRPKYYIISCPYCKQVNEIYDDNIHECWFCEKEYLVQGLDDFLTKLEEQEMEKLTKEEKTFITQLLEQLSWKVGQSDLMKMAESIIKKLEDKSEGADPSI